MTTQKYLCAFNRDRDSYQIPLSLAENGKLEKFLTDYYRRPWHHLNSLRHRQVSGLNHELTKNTFTAFALQGIWKKSNHLFPKIKFPEMQVDRYIANNVSQFSKKSSSNLLLYNNYARTFEDPWNREKLRVLFQFHPTPKFIKTLLSNHDIPKSAQEPVVSHYEYFARLSEMEVGNSHHIICASRFTKKSLVFSGYSENQITVIPYGSPTFELIQQRSKTGPIKFVFLGSAVRRKGFDLLLNVWPKFHALSGAELIVISRVRDETIKAIDHKSITYVNGLSAADLTKLLPHMDCLVLPSLVEGFGLVITEALGAGLHVLASESTGLIDLNLPMTAGTLIDGEVSTESILSGLIKSVSKISLHRNEITSVSQEFSRKNSWENYRKKIAECLKEIERQHDFG
jgi:glycosyltransferase involved in cell wall biosynthesis